MLKVLMVGNHPSSKGGMTSVINQIMCYDWRQEGIELSFIPTYIPGNPLKKILFFICAYIKILSKFLLSKPDVVHMHMASRGSFTRKYNIHKLCKLFSVKNVVHLHGGGFGEWYHTADYRKKEKIRRFFKESEMVIVLGENWEKIVHEIEPSVKTAIIHNCVEIPKDTAKWRDSQCEVMFLGTLISYKGVSDLLDAVDLLVRDGKIGHLHFTIAGIGEEEKSLEQKSKLVGIEKYVSFVGWVEGKDKADLLKNGQIFVLPSYIEGLPVAILEAASYGLPIVATDVGAIGSVVIDGVDGILFTPGDIPALAEGILTLTDRKTWEKYSVMAKKIIEENFSIDVFYLQLLEVWKNAVN